MTNKYVKHDFFLLLAALLIFGLGFFLEKQFAGEAVDYAAYSHSAQQVLNEEEKRCTGVIDHLSQKLEPFSKFDISVDYTVPELEKKINGFSYFVFVKDSLVYWSDNSVEFPFSHLTDLHDRQLMLLKNGWYESFKQENSNCIVAGLLLIKRQYEFQNSYLTNSFNDGLNLPEYANISRDVVPNSFPIKNEKGQYLFSVYYNPEEAIPGKNSYISLFYFFSFCLFIIFIYRLSKYLTTTRFALLSIITISILPALRIWSLEYKFPGLLYTIPLFNPKFYASTYLLNSLGDFLLSTLTFASVIVFFYRYYRRKIFKARLPKNKFLLGFNIVLVTLFIFIFSVLINYLLSGLIINSKISFNVNNIFELTFFSIIGFFIIGILLFTFYLVCEGGVRYVQKTRFNYPVIIILFLIAQGLFLLILIRLRSNEFFINYGVSTFLLTNFVIIFISYLRDQSKHVFSFTRSLLVILGFSLYAAQTISEFNNRKEKDNLRILAAKIENEQDLITEYLFDDIVKKIQSDRFISAYFTPTYSQLFAPVDLQEKIYRRISQVYLTGGYWTKFEIKIKCFDISNNSLSPSFMPELSIANYDSLIVISGKPTYAPEFYFINNSAGRGSYVGKIKISDPTDYSRQIGTIILILDTKFIQEEHGLPELLLSDKIPLRKDISNYSYARYNNGRLVTQFGKYTYYINPIVYEKLYGKINTEKFATDQGNINYFYKSTPESLIVITTKGHSLLEMITLFSYVFSFFCILFILLFLLLKVFNKTLSFDFDFKRRIQISVISVVISSIALIGGGTIYYIISSYVNNQFAGVSERLRSLLIALENELADQSQLDKALTEELLASFAKLSATLSVDFNVYNDKGALLFSSQPKIFEQGIISTQMNREAFEQLVKRQKAQIVQYEQIGNLSYLSAYEPIRSYDNKIIGYANLPYFARQNELKKEISSFLVTLINIYILLFAVAIVLTLIISNRITQPLKLIQQKLSKIKLGKSNELIEWDKKDEIGELVNQYNRMVEELAVSADMLARSERESAWREMAKQVAHEIKNPLTPMKLNVQHLQRAWKDKNTNIDEIISRVSGTLIEQIDTLGAIATEFSNFAKMPKANNTIIDLSQIVQNIINLYRESEEVSFAYTCEIKGELTVFADRDQVLRVFSNLIKNAVQAIPDNKHGKIEVLIIRSDNNYIVAVKDNGKGIGELQKANIFTPNFTTKTGGTGLGLAMSKNIIEYAGGKIWFESEPDKGTTFFVSIPVNQELN